MVNETGEQRRNRQRESVRRMLDGPIEDVYRTIEGTVGPVETAKAVINARAIAEAARAGVQDSKALVHETRRLVNWTRGLVFATITLVVVDLIFRLQ